LSIDNGIEGKSVLHASKTVKAMEKPDFIKSAHDPFSADIKKSNAIPPVGCYRPKFSQQEPRIIGKTYGKEAQWGNLGKDQAKRINKA